MSTRTIFLFHDCKVDLLNPSFETVSWDALAENLAKENRYIGGTPGVTYSVAEHISRGTVAIIDNAKDPLLAAYFSMHDTVEALLKDDPTPKKNAIAEIIQAHTGVLAPEILRCFDDLTERHDRAIHQAAGLAWPMHPEMAKRVKLWDLRMFVTEWRDLMGNIPHPDWQQYEGIEPLPDTIKPWAWEQAKNVLLNLWLRLLPALQQGRAA